MPLASGSKFGSYNVLVKLGEGGMGEARLLARLHYSNIASIFGLERVKWSDRVRRS